MEISRQSPIVIEPINWEREAELLNTLQLLFDRQVKFPVYNEEVWYQKFRSGLINWMFACRDVIKFSDLELYTAIVFQEQMLNCWKTSEANLKIISLACLLIAVKSEGEQNEFGMRDRIYLISKNFYSEISLAQAELAILKGLKWKIVRATPIHFLYIFKQLALFYQESQKEEIEKVFNYSKALCDFCQKEYKFIKYDPSELTAATILCSRRALKLTPEWPRVLNHFTTYSEAELKDCVDLIEKNFVKAL